MAPYRHGLDLTRFINSDVTLTKPVFIVCKGWLQLEAIFPYFHATLADYPHPSLSCSGHTQFWISFTLFSEHCGDCVFILHSVGSSGLLSYRFTFNPAIPLGYRELESLLYSWECECSFCEKERMNLYYSNIITLFYLTEVKQETVWICSVLE